MRNQEHPAAVIVRIRDVQPHPNADRLDVLTFPAPFPTKELGARHVQVVTGKHYQAGAQGEAVWFQPGAILPGWLAEELWMSHGLKTFEVRAFPIRGEMSDGLIAGRFWRKTPEHDFERWRFWKDSWHPGEDVSDYFGVWFPRPHSSVVEQSVSNREVAAANTSDGSNVVGAEPAVGSQQ